MRDQRRSPITVTECYHKGRAEGVARSQAVASGNRAQTGAPPHNSSSISLSIGSLLAFATIVEEDEQRSVGINVHAEAIGAGLQHSLVPQDGTLNPKTGSRSPGDSYPEMGGVCLAARTLRTSRVSDRADGGLLNGLALGLLAGGSPGTPHPGLFSARAVFAPDATRNGNTKLATGGLRDGKPPAAVRQECRRGPVVTARTSAGRPLHWAGKQDARLQLRAMLMAITKRSIAGWEQIFR